MRARAAATGEVYNRANERDRGGGAGLKGSVSHLAEVAREAGQTEALEAVHLVLAAAAIEARRARALVHISLAVLASEAWRAEAVVAVHQVLAREEEEEEEMEGERG